jgi:hypothetical protein
MADITETLKKLGLATARGVPQLATGFVDLAALPFTMTGMLKPEQAVGSTAYLTSKGLLPPEQKGLLSETTELVSSALNPATATKAALAKGGLLIAAPTVYHGTPHLFSATEKNVLGEFNPTKIGTGERNQMYGYGHYVGEAKGTGEKYKKDVSSDYLTTPSGELFNPFDSLQHVNVKAVLGREGFDSAIKKAKELASSGSPVASKAQQDLDTLLSFKEKGGLQPHSGYLYTVDLPDSSVRRMLDYDKELKNQPKFIRDLATQYNVDLNDIGFDLIQKIGNDAQGSEVMRKAGIQGIKYLDEMSRGNFKAQTTYKDKPYGDVISFATKKQLDNYISEKAKEGFGVKTFPQTRNFVVFPGNEGLLTINSRNK